MVKMNVKRQISFCLMVFISCGIFSCQHSSEIVTLKDACLETLYTLANTLVDLQVTGKDDSHFGAIQCPECNIYHTRAAEAVYPFAVAYKHTGQENYLQAAINVGNWLIKQQLAEGEWKETPWEWTGTTADQLLMMAQSYPLLKERLSEQEKAVWENSIKRAADYLVKYMSPDFASINYCPTTAAALAMTNKIIPDGKYTRKANKLARWTVAKMDDDGFIHGEAARVFGVKYGVDLGYEMDMSLWGLALYAKELDDAFVMQAVRKSLQKNLYFVYPNGAIDGSWGSRCYKWTTYGSKTADGCQILFGLFAQEDARYLTAAIRNLQYLRGMIKDGMIGNGPHFWELFDTLPCNYPTFARAKNLAMTVELGLQGAAETPPLPSDQTGWVKFYPTVNVALVRSKNLMTTISAYGYKDVTNWGQGKYTHHPGGGSVCNLWVQDHGFLQTSSQTRYIRGEVMHMPVVEDSVICLTPRIEFRNENGYFTNLYEREGRFSVRKGGQPLAIISTAGELKNEQYLPGGVAYIWTHSLFDNAIEKSVELRYHDRNPDVRIVEPIVQQPGMTFVQVDTRTVLIQGGKCKFKFELLEGNVVLELGEDEGRYWYPFPSIKAYPIVMKVQKPDAEFKQKIRYRFMVLK